MKNSDWADSVDFAIILCDENLNFNYLNNKAILNFKDSNPEKLIGTNIMDCHSENSQSIIKKIRDEHFVNCYTIEKNGKKKMIRQSPLIEDGVFKGIIEITFELPDDIPHFIR